MGRPVMPSQAVEHDQNNKAKQVKEHIHFSFHSTHANHRRFFITVNMDCSRGLRVERRYAIDQKQVLMVAMRQGHLNEPPTVHPPLHWERIWIPIVEVADEIHRFGVGPCTIEINRFSHVPRRVGRRV